MAIENLYCSKHTHSIFPKKQTGPSVYKASNEHMQPIGNKQENGNFKLPKWNVTSIATSSFLEKSWSNQGEPLYCFTHFEIYLPLYVTRVWPIKGGSCQLGGPFKSHVAWIFYCLKQKLSCSNSLNVIIFITSF